MSLARRHPVVAYFALAFLISWGGILLVTAPSGIPGNAGEPRLFLLVFASMAAGPSIAGIVMTALTEGTEGLRRLRGRLTHWRVGLRWYGVALLTTPIVLGGVLGLLTLASRSFTPGILATSDKLGLLGYALAGGFAAGLFEEIGWTGFATPRMLQRRALFPMALTLGVIWSFWHVLGDVWGATATFGALLVPRILLWTFAMMTPYRVLMTWVYTRTRSVLLAVLMHAAFPGGQALLTPLAASPAQHLAWYAVFAAALWVLAGLAVVFDRPARAEPAVSGQNRRAA